MLAARQAHLLSEMEEHLIVEKQTSTKQNNPLGLVLFVLVVSHVLKEAVSLVYEEFTPDSNIQNYRNDRILLLVSYAHRADE